MTTPKPDCWAPELAASFHLDAVAGAYRFRPPYAPSLFTTLAGLVVDEPRTVLDLGCGPGDLARHLASMVDRVDAVDVSLAMIQQGRALEHGDHPGLRWIHGSAEDAPLDPPYALVVAGDSLHWMDWPVIVPRIRDVLAPNGLLAIAAKVWGTGAPEEREIWVRYGRSQTWRPLDLVQELGSRGLFEKRGAWGFTAAWRPTIDEYLAASRSPYGARACRGVRPGAARRAGAPPVRERRRASPAHRHRRGGVGRAPGPRGRRGCICRHEMGAAALKGRRMLGAEGVGFGRHRRCCRRTGGPPLQHSRCASLQGSRPNSSCYRRYLTTDHACCELPTLDILPSATAKTWLL